MNKHDIKKLRTELGLSQEAFGEVVGRSRWQIMRYEEGSWPIPDYMAEYIIPNKTKDLKRIIQK